MAVSQIMGFIDGSTDVLLGFSRVRKIERGLDEVGGGVVICGILEQGCLL